METLPALIEALPRLFSRGDLVALAVFLLCSALTTQLIEHPPRRRPSVSSLMGDHRRRWMEEVGRREVRIMDAQLLSTLRQGSAFFGSTSLIAIGGVAALIGQTDQLVSLGRDFGAGLAQNAEVVWEAKLLIVLLVLVNAFLKFVWAHRLFGYVAVLLGALPRSDAEGLASAVARVDAIHQAAARNFNRGLRTVYFAIAALGWFLGPAVLALTAVLTTLMLIRREFFSRSWRALDESGRR
ncbi:DUF599 domain-containing protein [Paralimibaculum aggregatum]|uniref:DUF599 domain-containing protein n=1 Tax=Paralimibaculum aggregatum TaxID=3036245 RepID=A0ABQ6LD20_9RHOB|nr:DUF599 domain-containing protein [Limibaculum sp. NKW23]GMG81255.1 DUF599 domain-containing protein [Limibaculum sp. NKW23]